MIGRSLLPTACRIRRSLTGAALAFVLAISVHAGEQLAFTTISAGDYASFLVNWDDATTPVFRAVIRTPEQYEAAFHPAPVMGNPRPFGPPDGFFDQWAILVVARVIDAPAAGESPLTVESVTAEGDDLELRYRFGPPAARATFTVKEVLAVRVPKRPLDRVRFVENGEPLGELHVAGGEWAVPLPPAD